MERQPKQARPKEVVPVQWKKDDALVAAIRLSLGDISLQEFMDLPQNTITTLTGEQINRFCGPCDNFGPDGVCVLGRQDQTRYVAREWCGWASVNGNRGTMTDTGFKTGK